MLEHLQDKPFYVDNLPFKLGESFPHLVLPSIQDAEPLSLAKFSGQKVLLHIFASW